MLRLISEESKTLLLSLSRSKKIAFLILLSERMEPELKSYFLTRDRNFIPFQMANERFWLILSRDQEIHSSDWEKLQETLLDMLPDSEDDGSLAAQLALNAGLVAAATAAFANDGQDIHLTDAIENARDSIHAKAASEVQTLVYDKTVEEAVNQSPLLFKERRREEADVAFLVTLPEAPWSVSILSLLHERAKTQERLLGE
jgi:hypothetical protein